MTNLLAPNAINGNGFKIADRTGAPISREAHKLEWTETRENALYTHRTIVSNALANGETRVDGSTVDLALTAVEDLLDRCESALHFSTVMTFSTRARLDQDALDAMGPSDDSCPFCRNGYIAHYAHIDNGICYRCDGEG